MKNSTGAMIVLAVLAWPALAAAQSPLRIETTNGQVVLLQQRTEQFQASGTYSTVYGSAYRDLCASPCDQPVPRGVMVRLTAPGMTDSSTFLLRPDTSALRVTPGNRAGWLGGIWLAVGGSMGMLVGSIIALAGTGSESNEGMIVPGLVVAGASIPLLIWGIVKTGANSTDVTQSPSGETARLRRPGGVRWIPGGVAF